MTLRRRIALTAAAAVAVALVVVSVVVYGTTARRVTADADAELARAAQTVLTLTDGAAPGDRLAAVARLREPGRRPPRRGEVADRFFGTFDVGVVQQVDADGVVRTVGAVELPVDEDAATVAASSVGSLPPRTVDVDGVPVRVLTVGLGGGDGALQLGIPVEGAVRTLEALRRQLALAGLLGVGLAGGLGALVADRAVRPVRQLTSAAEQVRRTQDLTTRIDVVADDELGRLASSFNEMLASLATARAAQQQLVADASHELRTPLTSLRTNIEVLQLADGLDATERSALVADVTAQLDEFGRLVDGLVELARGDGPARAPTRVALADVVADAVDRVAVFAPDVSVTVTADDSVVSAERDRLERAVANLLDNAVKHGASTPVHVTVADGGVVVRDHGPGIPDADVAQVFDRFYRSPEARSRPGSGLGLSIVAQVAEAHGGDCTARTHPEGGAEVALRLPTV